MHITVKLKEGKIKIKISYKGNLLNLEFSKKEILFYLTLIILKLL